MGWGLVASVLLCGCTTGDPLAEAPWPAGLSSTWFEVRLGDDVIGIEQQGQRGAGSELWRRRWERVQVDGEVMDVVRGAHSGLGSEGRPVDAFGGPLVAGPVGLPYGDAVLADVIRRSDGEGTEVFAYWDGPDASARFDRDGALVLGRLGAVSWTRVDRRPDPWPPVELHRVLAIATPVIERPRRRRIGKFLVDGRPVLVQSPLLQELPNVARGLPGRTDDAVARFSEQEVRAVDVSGAAAELAAAVARTVSDEARPGPSTGAGVLSSRRGDCTEHTALFLAAADAAGLEARPIAGLLYLDDGAVGSGLYPHAWAEVLVGRRWVAVDPTLGMWPADAARVPLGPRIDRAMDRVATGLAIEVVDIR